MASSGVPPPIPGRRPPPSGPPPIPSRVDLGEAPVQAVSAIKEQSMEELPKKGSPKLKYDEISFLFVLHSITFYIHVLISPYSNKLLLFNNCNNCISLPAMPLRMINLVYC